MEQQITLLIDGMMCNHCRQHVEQALNALPGVRAEVDLEKKRAVCAVKEGATLEMLKKAVQDAGYTVTGTEA